MRSLWRRVGLISLIALILNVTMVFAQDTVTAVGSGITAPIIGTAAETSGTAVNVSVVGTDRGIQTFCAGEADLALATRPLSSDEELNCSVSGVSFLELLAGYNAVAFVSSPDSTFNQCLTTGELRTLLAPSAQGQVTDWSQVNAANASSPITLFVPSDSASTYAALDTLVDSVGIRADAQVATDDEAISAVTADPNALAVVSYTSAAAAGDSVRLLQLNGGTAGCTSPSIESIEGREYPGAERLFVYVNSASLSKAGLSELLSSAFGEAAATSVSELGYVAPSTETNAINQELITNFETGRRFSRDVDAFVAPTNLVGEITLGGSAANNTYIQAITTGFTTTQPAVTLTQSYLGQPDGFRRLCNGELDIAVAYSDLSTEQADNCSANNIEIVPVALGNQAVVLVANAASNLTCLTTAELTTLWSAASAGTVTNWSQVNASLPDTAFTLFAPEAGSVYTDILLTDASGAVGLSRIDTEVDDDASYRAAATANVEGALTYMSWQEYETVLQNGQANVALVSVDGGSGCVEPSESTIGDSTYPLTRPLHLLVKRTALARPEIQALLIFIASDENYATLATSGLIGLSFADLADLRFSLQNTFTEVLGEVAQITPEGTAEATPDAEATESAPEGDAATTEPEAAATEEAAVETDSEVVVTPEATESAE